MKLTMKKLQSLLTKRFKGILKVGKHNENGECCVRELRACALEIPWTDSPDNNSATDKSCQRLNDARWSSDAVRTEHCLPLALLTESEAAPGWVKNYAERTIREIISEAMETAAKIHPDKKHQDALNAAGKRCREEGTKESAHAAYAAAYAANAAAKDAAYAAYAAAAKDAAYAAYAAYAATNASYAAANAAAHAADAAADAAYAAANAAANAADAAADAAYAAANAAANADAVLIKAVKILIETHQGK